jgi:hypothetical protein
LFDCILIFAFWLRGRLRVCAISHAAVNEIGDSGCSALAQTLPHLSALQELNLRSDLILFMFFCLFAV